MIERAAIEQRKEQLQGRYDQTVANANALQGAIQECNFWIAQLGKQEADASTVQVATKAVRNRGA